MAVSKPKKPQRTPEDLELIKSEVSSFASSLGLAGAPLSSAAGFDDSDFRKSGPIKPPKTLPPKSKPIKFDENKKNPSEKSQPDAKIQSKPHPLQIDPFLGPTKAPNAPKIPLMKASLLSAQWYADAEELESKVLGSGEAKALTLSAEELKWLAASKKEITDRILDQYTRDYEASRRRSGDMRLLEMTAKSGTSADKISAFTCLVEDNPIANMRSLDALLSMVTSKVGKRYAFTGFEAIKELFLLRLLPDRKLKCLFQRPLDKLPETKDGFSLLLFWYWEECLKQRYERFVIALEEALKDMLPTLKDRAMKTLYILLKSKSEQERRLLSALVNKLGDPERKAASSAGYYLSCLLSAHPNMKAVVIEEVDSFIFRPHIGLRAKYQAVNFLTQIFLSKKGDGPKVAKRLVDVYFALFKELISDGRDGKFMGKNDHTSGKNGKKKEKRDKKKTVNSFRNHKKEHAQEPHIEMDSRLLSALLTGVNRAFPFVSSDEADDIVEDQTPILFKLVYSVNFNVGVQALMLLYQISSKNQIAGDRFYRALYSKLLTPSALNSSKLEMFLGLLVKAMKNDINLKRVSAFSKRLLQVALQLAPQCACGCLFLLSEVLKAKPPLWSMVLQHESVDDDLEHFEDIIEDVAPSLTSTITDCKEDSNSKGENGASTDSGSKASGSSLPAGYDPRRREPSYCNADRVSWWELTALASHVHPSVATMARTLLSGANIVYNGDPLNDLSLIAFLDKFMEKKPKPNKKAEGIWHGGSQIAPARKLDLNQRLIGDEILQLAEEDVAAEDVVFHRFYANKTSSSKKKPKAKKKAEMEADDGDVLLPDSDDEEEIDNMLGSGPVPSETDGGDYDYDDLDGENDDEDLLGSDDDDGHIEPDGDDSDDESNKIGKKRKLGGKARASPFASLHEYEHLLNDNVDATATKTKSPKKKKASV